MNPCASLTPPDALTPISGPTVFLIKAISSFVAPPVEKPVDVLTKSAPASLASKHALTFSSSLNKQVSIITFKVLPWQACLIALISFNVYASSFSFKREILMTISISSAPSSTAFLVSSTLEYVLVAPKGKPTTVHTKTSLPSKSFLQRGIYEGLIHTDLKP